MKGRMEAVAAVERGWPGMLELEIPRPGEYEALVRMDACAICNSTDTKLMDGEFFPGPFPVVLGHEVIGTVVEVGPKAANFRPGDRVFRQKLEDRHVPGRGRSCWGGFAEYGVVTDEWSRRGLPFSQEALPHPQQKLLVDCPPAEATAMVTLMETLDCAVSCGIGAGKTVAVVGSGPVGQAFALHARLLGAKRVYAFGRTRRYAARFGEIVQCDGYVIGADYPPEAAGLIGAEGFDVVMEAAGSAEALEQAVLLAGSEGRVCVYGIAPESHAYGDRQLAHPRVERVGAVEGRAQSRLVDFLDRGLVRLEDWVTSVHPLAEFAEAFRLVRTKQSLKAVLTASQ